MSDDKTRPSVPFEPRKPKQRKSASKGTPIVKSPAPSTAKISTTTKRNSPQEPLRERESSQIPEVVSNRMIRRVMIFSGIPVLIGMGIFIVSYLVVANHITKLPNTAVLLVSMAFLGLSVLGLSYGILSASWEEDINAVGSWLGWSEFKLNFSRMKAGYKASKQMQQNNER
jgi:hypothetical protein